MFQKLRTHAYTGIRNRPSVCTDSILYIYNFCYGSNLSSRPVILNTISVDIQKNLSQMQGTSIYIRILDFRLFFLINPLNFFFCCPVNDNALNLIGQFFETDIFMSKNNLAFFNFTHLQNIINKREQIIRCYLHLFMIFLYQHLIIKMILIHLYQTNHTIQRCPDIMTHAAEKIRFCSALGPHFIECRLKTCLFLLIPFMFLCSILQQNDCIDHRYLSKHFCIKHYHPGHKNCFLYPADTSILFTDTIFHRYMCFSIFKSLT